MNKLTPDEAELQTKKVNKFLQIVSNSLYKHFRKWLDTPLLVHCLFSEAPTSSAVAHYLLGSNMIKEQNFYSKEHNTNIDILDFFNFLKECGSESNKKEVLELDIVARNIAEVTMIKDGSNMWNNAHKNSPLGNFLNIFKQRLCAQGSNAQCTERGVKEAGYVALGNRSEGTRSIVALARGDTIEEVGISVREKLMKAKGETGDGKVELQVQNKEKARQIIAETDAQELKLRLLEKKKVLQLMRKSE